jgi:putative OPT family oligopeptide transporter
MALMPAISLEAAPSAEAAEPAAVTPPVAAAIRESELTPRALVFGCALGVLMAAGNVYTGLKTAWIDGGSITVALLGFAFFSTFNRFFRGPFGVLENNVAQTTASSAAIMGFAIGLPGSVPALQLMGHEYPAWSLVVWGIALGGMGVAVGAALRRKLIVGENLPFPTGAATAEVIETISSSGQTAMRRARLLLVAALVAMVFAWFRDGRPSVIPQSTAFGGAILGVSLASVTVGISWSPLLVSTGLLIGFRNAFSMLLAGTTCWFFLAPWLVRDHIVAGPGFGPEATWFMWPGVGLLLASSFVPLVMDWRGLVRSFRDIPSLLRRRAGDVAPGERLRMMKPIVLASFVTLLVVGTLAFHIPPLMTVLGCLVAVVLANVCARSAGETDLAPTGVLGTLTQLTFAGNGSVVSLFAGSITSGVSSQAAQTLWALRAGRQLNASPRAQLRAELLGSVLGAIVSVPVYIVIVKAYGLGTEAMPAPSALSWKATAEAVRDGLSSMPRHAPLAGLIGFGIGILCSALSRGRWGRFVPSAAAMGMAVLSPFSLSLSICIGGLVSLVFARLRPSQESASDLMAVAAGGIAGESVMGVIIAFLIAFGLL